ncbi:cysteine-rich repeat secretory protein 38-like [Neltuma alba]|uniref:cysteine-rich repeat secretory protein 38-like n=1 Tax=Neltuma alba TaxID=207710 RepID=UPI0010A30DC6|nr:cysteine-rich repeat secretory protein 38-like [Prosopis alba]
MTTSVISLALVLFSVHLTVLSGQPNFVFYKCFIGKGTYPNKSPYETNLNTLLSKITSNTIIDHGFYSSNYGQAPNIVHVRGLCRGDVNPMTCRNCLNDAKTLLPKRLKSEAASGDSNFKLSVGCKIADESETVYGLVQCSPDLSRPDCNACLEKAISDIPLCCKNKIGGRIIKLSCNLRFERVHFYYD